ncbi:hypothetical protein ACFPM0_17895 [Pseudonocardia sulfidoxydans]|uniref:hypothetical protein n=1 Tax=Pseudonocardia sulfidoxydans TaxID=54011 RepID=UPI0036102C62
MRPIGRRSPHSGERTVPRPAALIVGPRIHERTCRERSSSTLVTRSAVGVAASVS